ncbi:MAG TPA: transcription termination factor NusA [Candidatus Atribacteria bacterium]|nr:transcription termination factor NusA [Candidatus Atribacteria bacterium]HPU08126.1 transcription termination factor NusA [Candidatus Atribacteria bacterium]HPZ81306.1 transcription termination factor NusA [Candidatus Atribacteria bacterium]
MSKEIFAAIEQIEKTKGIPQEVLKEAVEAALLSAYRKNFRSSHKGVSVTLNPQDGTIKVFARKTVVDKLRDSATEILEEEAKRLGFDAQVGDVVEIEVTPQDFGRIAAQTAKQVIIQRIKEAERDLIYEEFVEREGEIITGIISKREGNNVIVDLGKTDALLPFSEQTSTENYRIGERMKFYIVEVKKTSKGSRIVLSRTHPGLVRRLFELEVPEVHDGLVDIRAIAREPGVRSKVIVESRSDNVDPVGSCIGNRGSRVKNITDELRGEKIDIIKWSNDPRALIAESLSPARVIRVELDEETNTARVFVPEDQVSLAIGKDGQNARLTARVTGWRIDINREENGGQKENTD